MRDLQYKKMSESGASTDLNKLTLAKLTNIDFTFWESTYYVSEQHFSLFV